MHLGRAFDDLTIKFALIFIKMFPGYLCHIYIFKHFLKHLSAILASANFSNISKKLSVLVLW